MRCDEFKSAVLDWDREALEAALSPEVRFFSPAVFKPYEGREATMAVLEAVSRVLEDFRYVDAFAGEDGEVLLFAARVGDRELNGIDLLRFDEQGKVRELMVMIRPLTGLQAAIEAMGRELERMGIPVGR